MRDDNCAAYCQAEPQALRLRGKKRIENALQVRGWDATTLVVDGHTNAASVPPRCAHHEYTLRRSAVGHSAASVHDQVQENLLKLYPIAVNGRQVKRKVAVYSHSIAPQIGMRQPKRILNQLVQVERLILRFSLLEQLAQAVDDLGSAPIVFDNVLKDVAHFIEIGGIVREKSQGGLSVAEDGRQRLV